MKTWVLVVSREGARLFDNSKKGAPFNLLREFHNPDGKKKNRELTSDKPGRGMESGAHHHAFSSNEDPKEHVLNKFAHFVAKEIDLEMGKIQIDEVFLMGDPHVVGVLRPLLGKQTLEKMRAVISKNLYHATEPEIREQISQAG